MAGRGRGRGGFGRGKSMSFSIENLGFGRGEALPGPILEPPPLYLPQEFKPVPLDTGEQHAYMLALKQEFRSTMQESPYYINPPGKKKDIVRYSDKYQSGPQENAISWQPDWTRLPAELKIRVRKRSRVKAVIQPKLNIPRKSAAQDVTQTLEILEKQETNVEPEEEEEKEKEEDEDQEEGMEDEEYYDEEELEEETDYNLTYFDNGENYGADEDDDLDDGPIY